MGAGLVQPEYGRRTGRTGARNGQLDPILNRGIFNLAGTPNIAGFHLMLVQDRAVRIHDADGAVGWRLEGLVV